MGLELLLTTLVSGFVIAFVHTLIPVHWLPYALAGKARGWSLRRTLIINAAGGLGHVLITALLGALALVLGASLDYLVEGIFPWLVVALLLLLGGYFLYRQFVPAPRAHTIAVGVEPSAGRSDRAATLALVTMLLLSPCEAFVPVYLVSGGSWVGFVLLTVTLALATISCMLMLTMLAWRGMASGAAAPWLRWQSGIVGIVLIGLAAVLMVWRP